MCFLVNGEIMDKEKADRDFIDRFISLAFEINLDKLELFYDVLRKKIRRISL